MSETGKCWNRRDEEFEMLNQIKKLVLDESGLETIEWAFVGGVIVALTVAFFVSIGVDVFRGVTALDAVTSNIMVVDSKCRWVDERQLGTHPLPEVDRRSLHGASLLVSRCL